MTDDFREQLVAMIPKLRSYAFVYARSGSDADDLVQAALLRAWRYRDSFKLGTNMKAWLFQILRNEYMSAAVAARRLPALAVLDTTCDACSEPDQEWRLAFGDLMRDLRRLPPDNREAILLTAGLGLSYTEAAEVCGCDSNVLKQRVFRARRRLQADSERANPTADAANPVVLELAAAP